MTGWTRTEEEESDEEEEETYNTTSNSSSGTILPISITGYHSKPPSVPLPTPLPGPLTVPTESLNKGGESQQLEQRSKIPEHPREHQYQSDQKPNPATSQQPQPASLELVPPQDDPHSSGVKTGIKSANTVKFRDISLSQQDSLDLSSSDISSAMHSAEAPVGTEQQQSLSLIHQFNQMTIAKGRSALGHSTPLNTSSIMDYSLNPDHPDKHKPPANTNILPLDLDMDQYSGPQSQSSQQLQPPRQPSQRQSPPEDVHSDTTHPSLMELDSIDINSIDPTVPKKRNPGPRIFDKLVVRSLIRCQGRVGRAPALIDSGASSFFVSQRLLKRLRVSHLTEPCDPQEVNPAFGPASAIINQQITLNITIGSVTISECMFIVSQLYHDLILGTPFLKDYQEYIDWSAPSFDSIPATLASPTFINNVEFRRLARSKDNRISLCQIRFVGDTDKGVLPPEFQSYSDVVTNEPPGKLPPERSISHRIDTKPGTEPTARSPFNHSIKEEQLITKEVQKLIESGFIRPSSSPYSAPVLLIRKKDGSVRMCIDYRLLNQITVKNKYPLPRIDDLFHNLDGAQIFTILDLQSGYHQIRIHPKHIHKSAFSTKTGHWEFLVMPFGLTNAPATFQNYMNDIFRPFLGKFVVVYLDDILIYSRTREEHESHVRQVLELLRQHQLRASLKKCAFFQQSLEYLGFQVSAEGIAPTQSKVEAITKYPAPKTPKECMRFMGLANFYRRFVPHFSHIAAPLTQYMSSPKLTPWSPVEEAAFQQLNSKLTTPTLLITPSDNYTFVLTTDASNIGIGATLEQFDGSKKVGVVAYFSRKLQGAQLNYAVQDLEFLAIVEALKHFRPLLVGNHFILRTDHISLTYLHTQSKTPRGRIARWLDLLADYDFTTQYIKGSSNTAADTLSRVPINNIDIDSDYDELLQKVAQTLKTDPFFSDIIQHIEDPESPKHTKYSSQFSYDNELLYFLRFTASDDNHRRLCVPESSLRQLLITKAHNASHSGPYNTYLSLTADYYWPYMFRHIKKHIQKCNNCQRNKPEQRKTQGLLQPLEIPENRWSSVSMDFITGLPVSQHYDMILVVVDRLTKRAHFIPTKKSLTGHQLAQTFSREILRLHGFPTEIISDRDVRYSTFWNAYTTLFGARLSKSTAYHPETDGQTERLNRILRQLLRTFCYDNGVDWYFYIDQIEFAYNSAHQATIQTTPFTADLGYQPRQPALIRPPPRARIPENVESLAIKLKAILLRTQEYMASAQLSQQVQADKSRRPVEIKVGDSVLIHRSSFHSSSDRIMPLYVGPYLVVSQVGPNAFELDLPTTLKSHRVINVSKLRKFEYSEAYPTVPLPSIQYVLLNIHNIVSLALISNNGYYLQFVDSLPGHCVFITPSMWPQLPAALRDRLIRDYKAIRDSNQLPLQARDEPLHDGG